MLRAVTFDEFSLCCPYYNPTTDVNNGYGCDHPKQEESDYDEETGKEQGKCYCWSCPLGIEAEQADLTDKKNSDAVQEEIDWDGLCECGEVGESEYLLVCVDEKATSDEKNALYEYDRFIHRYDKKWLDEHDIPN